jgi:hypothetical protein
MLSLLSWQNFVIHDGSESFWGTGTGPGEKQGSLFQLSDNWVTRIMWAAPQRRRLVASFPQRRPGFEPRSGHVGFVVGKVTLGQAFSEYFGFSCQFSFHWLLHIHQHLSSGAGTIGQLVAEVPSGLSLTPPQETKKKTNYQNHTMYSSTDQCGPGIPVFSVSVYLEGFLGRGIGPS